MFHAYQQPITTYLSHLLGDAERGEELAREAFLRVCRLTVKGTGAAYANAWLYGITTTIASRL